MPEYADAVLKQIIAWQDQGYGVALAGVVSTWGASPRSPGSLLGINEKGQFIGSVSGGCIESYVVSEAIDIIEAGEPQLLEYGVSDQRAREVRLSCGGSVRVYVERAPPGDELKRLMSGPVARVIDLSSGASVIVDEDTLGTVEFGDDALEAVRSLLRRNASGTVADAGRELFVTTYAGSRRLIIVGAVHIAQVLASMAASIGMDVIVVDARPAFATAERFPGVDIIQEPTKKAMQRLTLDSGTSVVTLAHDPDLDDPALHAALKSNAGFIGCLGSRRTHASRLKRLRQSGFSDKDLARLHGPVGLDIGGRSPGEIAVAILAQIVAVYNDRRGTYDEADTDLAEVGSSDQCPTTR